MNENYVVTVDLELKNEADFQKAYNALMKNALSSLKNEEGCLRFDVIKINESSDFMLYEIYKNKKSFLDHLNTNHYLEFKDLSTSIFGKIEIRFGYLKVIE